MTIDHGGSIPHAQPHAWRFLPRYERVHDTITEGDAVGVLLTNRPDRVWLDQADYQRIIATHGAKRWRWIERSGGVYMKDAASRTLPVARLVLEVDASGFVQYRDGDRLNLRREALSIDPHRMPGRGGVRKKADREEVRLKPTGWATKRAPSGPTIRPFVLPPAVTVRPQVAPPAVRVIPKKPVTVIQGVPRSARVLVPPVE